MKKNITLLVILVASSLAYAQVGINTDSPKSTLDIAGKPTDTSTIDGLLAPRISGNELRLKDGLYGTSQTGALVYVTAAASPKSTKTANVTEAGYYYFNGSVWINTAADIRNVGNHNHVSYDAGVGGNGSSLGTGNNNIAIGSLALNSITTSDHNIALGNSALSANTTGGGNIAIGQRALQSNTVGLHNNAFGRLALEKNTIGTENNAFGYGALGANVNGNLNNAFGYGAMTQNISGSSNNAFGEYVLNSNTTGNGNNAYGYNALNKSNGNGNSAFGEYTLLENTSGSGNTAIGGFAGDKNTTGSNNTFVGKYAQPSSGALTNATAIGYNAKVSQSNSLILGGTGYEAVNVGIGTTVPKSKLHITSGDIYLDTVGKGVIMKSPDGNCWRVTVKNNGKFASNSIVCP